MFQKGGNKYIYFLYNNEEDEDHLQNANKKQRNLNKQESKKLKDA